VHVHICVSECVEIRRLEVEMHVCMYGMKDWSKAEWENVDVNDCFGHSLSLRDSKMRSVHVKACCGCGCVDTCFGHRLSRRDSEMRSVYVKACCVCGCVDICFGRSLSRRGSKMRFVYVKACRGCGC
jgi:hypothetical protein